MIVKSVAARERSQQARIFDLSIAVTAEELRDCPEKFLKMVSIAINSLESPGWPVPIPVGVVDFGKDMNYNI